MCTYGKKCMYKTSPNPQTGIPCSFAHSESELQIPICVYGSACKFNKSGTCSYKHVEGVEVSEETIVSISLKITTSSTSKLEKAHPIICKFGSSCKFNKMGTCRYTHSENEENIHLNEYPSFSKGYQSDMEVPKPQSFQKVEFKKSTSKLLKIEVKEIKTKISENVEEWEKAKMVNGEMLWADEVDIDGE